MTENFVRACEKRMQIRRNGTVELVKSVSTDTLAGYRDLNDFGQGLVASARKMVSNI